MVLYPNKENVNYLFHLNKQILLSTSLLNHFGRLDYGILYLLIEHNL